VIADPKPQDSALDVNAEGAMIKADSTRPEVGDAFETQRGMTRIGLEKLKFLVSQTLHCRAQAPVAGPEVWRGKMPQNSVDLPFA
jgi:hypothetical protein